MHSNPLPPNITPSPKELNVVLKSRHGSASGPRRSGPGMPTTEPLLALPVTPPWRAMMACLLPAPGWHAWLPAPAFTSHHLPSWHLHAMRTTLGHWCNLITLGGCVLGFLFEKPPSSHGCWISVTYTLRIFAAMDCLASSDAIATMMCLRDQGQSMFGTLIPIARWNRASHWS